jgi:hypothetical protein
MNLQAKLDRLHRETVSMLCGIQEMPEGLLPLRVYVEEETGQSLDYGNSVYNVYNLIKIFHDGVCLLENSETGKEEKRKLSEINTGWLITVWNRYQCLSGIREPGENCVMELLRSMELIASNLITTRYITDFTVHDTHFIHRTNAGKPFIWLVYESGTHLYVTDDMQDVRNFLQILDYYEQYSQADFCLYRYDGDKLFPVFPQSIRKFIESDLSTQNTKINS